MAKDAFVPLATIADYEGEPRTVFREALDAAGRDILACRASVAEDEEDGSQEAATAALEAAGQEAGQ